MQWTDSCKHWFVHSICITFWWPTFWKWLNLDSEHKTLIIFNGMVECKLYGLLQTQIWLLIDNIQRNISYQHFHGFRIHEMIAKKVSLSLKLSSICQYFERSTVKWLIIDGHWHLLNTISVLVGSSSAHLTTC